MTAADALGRVQGRLHLTAAVSGPRLGAAAIKTAEALRQLAEVSKATAPGPGRAAAIFPTSCQGSQTLSSFPPWEM